MSSTHKFDTNDERENPFERSLERIQDGILGNNKGIPIQFPRLSNYWPYILRHTYYLVGAAAKIGKTSFVDDVFLYNAIDYCIPQFESSYNIHLNNKNDWMLISGSFTATGGEKFLTIGNFKKPIDTNIQTLSSGTLPFAYYYIDDVSVMDCNDTLSSVNEINQQYDVILYPNPNNGTFTIECSAFETGKAILNIYDVTGKKIAEHLVNSKNKTLTINENSLDAGVYYYQIMVNDKTMKSDKLVIIK